MIRPPLAALPDLHALPGPFWLLTTLHLLTFALHLAAMSSLLGGLVVVLADRSPDRWARPAVRRLLALFPVLMAATVTLGVAPLLFLQLSYGKVAYSAAITSATFWLLVPFLAMAAYAALYAASHRPAGDAAAGRRLALALALLTAVSLVYSSTFALAERPDAYARLYKETASGFALNPDVATWGPRWFQAVAGAVAVGAFVTGLVARDDERLRTKASHVLSVAVVVAALAGALRFTDAAFRHALDLAGGLAYGAGLMLPFLAAAIGHAAARRRRTMSRGREWAAGSLLALGLVASVVARHTARLGALSGAFDPAAPGVRPQWDVFALFVVFLLAAVGAMAWMLRVWFASAPRRAE